MDNTNNNNNNKDPNQKEQRQEQPDEHALLEQRPILRYIICVRGEIGECHQELRLLSTPIVLSPFSYCQDKLLPRMVTKDNAGRLRSLIGSITRADFVTLQKDLYITADMVTQFITLCIVTSKSTKDIQFVDESFSNYISAYHEPDREQNFTVDTYYSDLFQPGSSNVVAGLEMNCSRMRWTQKSLMVWVLAMRDHWMLCLVDCEQLVVEVYESMNSEVLVDFWCDAVKKVLVEERFTSKEFQERIRAKSGGLSVKRLGGHQTSGNSCGAFVSFYAFFRIQMDLTPESVQNHRDCTPAFMVKTFRRFMELELSFFLNKDDTIALRSHLQTLV
jgi:hypothetical protein